MQKSQILQTIIEIFGMKMEEHEIFSHFEFENERWTVKFELDYTREHPELVIEATDTLSATVSATRWRLEHLSAFAEMKLIFPTLEELFYYLAHHSKSLQVSSNSIQFVVSLGQGMKDRKLPFSIALSPREMNKEDLNELKIKLLENKLEKELRIRDQQIKSLQKAVELLTNRLDSSPPKQSNLFKAPLIQPHPYNPDNACFSFSAGANGLRVKRVNSNSWTNFIADTPITSPTTFKVKLWKLSQGCLCLGVGTQSMFGVHNYHQVEFVNYDFELKQIAVSEKKINAPSMARNGSIVTVKCDPKTFKIWWACDEKQIGTTTFPQQIRSQELYLIAYFKNASDELQIWQE